VSEVEASYYHCLLMVVLHRSTYSFANGLQLAACAKSGH
jgi:hypothetical protein